MNRTWQATSQRCFYGKKSESENGNRPQINHKTRKKKGKMYYNIQK